MKRTLISWIPLALAITGICGLIYITVQQNFRMNANDPQIQIAQDIAVKLGSGVTTDNIIPTSKVDIDKSLATYAIVYDSNGKELASSANLNGASPKLPDGVIDNAKKNDDVRITWEPASGVRSAIVIKKFEGKASGFALVGRSLKEVEIREDNLMKTVLIGYFGLLAVTFLAIFGLKRIYKD